MGPMTSTPEYVEVSTRAGVVRGRWRDTTGGLGNAPSAAFEGIPFAEPPVGELRFASPVPKAPWEGVRDALEFGATAQRGDPGVTLIPEPSVPGESTLNVNVYTPSPIGAAPGEGMPVLVWIHGGGFFAGSPASPWYDGRNFNRDGVVTVTLSYRLGFDGFGWIDGAPSNRGVRDWLLALEWVQQNIAAFGGDPGRVTIAGQSAGGGAVLTLLGMEKAQHLFHGVYSLSGALADVSQARAKALSESIARELEVPATRAGFASIPEERILEAQKKATELGPDALGSIIEDGLAFGPQVDGDLLVRPTRESILAGVGAGKPLVAGAARDEFTMALEGAARALRWAPKKMLLAKMMVPKAARAAYLAANRDVTAKGNHFLAGRALSDQMFTAPLLRIVAARGAGPTWVYQFAWPSGKFGLAGHCLDVPFFFDCLDGPAIAALTGPNPPQALADELHARVVEFVSDGDPGWPRYDSPRNVVRVYDTPVADVPDGYASVYPLV